MRKFIIGTLLLLTLGIASMTHAQSGAGNVGNTVMRRFPGVPSGTCAPNQVAVDNSNNEYYDCDNTTKTWVMVGGGGGGSIDGTIADTQIAFGTAADTIGGDSQWTWDNTGKKASLGPTLSLPMVLDIDTVPANTDGFSLQKVTSGNHFASSFIGQATSTGGSVGIYTTGIGLGSEGSGTGIQAEGYEAPGMGETVTQGGAGIFASHGNYGVGTLNWAAPFRGVASNLSTGTVTEARTFWAQPATNAGGGTLGTAYGFYSQGQTAGSTANYSFFSLASQNFFKSPNAGTCEALLCLSGEGYGDVDGFGSHALLDLNTDTASFNSCWRNTSAIGAYWCGGMGVSGNIAMYGTLDNMEYTGYTVDLTNGVVKFDAGGGGATLISAPRYDTLTNCSDSAGDAACGSAPEGAVVVDAADTTTVVSTDIVTANSNITVEYAPYVATRLGVTCNATAVLPTVTAISVGTSFTITVPVAPVTNPACFVFRVTN